eukprot:GHVR01106937.1.p1 GENE.GHVR01106937.1~~GHVR01106937.1.p1  ORF type:complete len:700 (+),score=235.78 GHVR01106937.1:36-2135(+)
MSDLYPDLSILSQGDSGARSSGYHSFSQFLPHSLKSVPNSKTEYLLTNTTNGMESTTLSAPHLGPFASANRSLDNRVSPRSYLYGSEQQTFSNSFFQTYQAASQLTPQSTAKASVLGGAASANTPPTKLLATTPSRRRRSYLQRGGLSAHRAEFEKRKEMERRHLLKIHRLDSKPSEAVGPLVDPDDDSYAGNLKGIEGPIADVLRHCRIHGFPRNLSLLIGQRVAEDNQKKKRKADIPFGEHDQRPRQYTKINEPPVAATTSSAAADVTEAKDSYGGVKFSIDSRQSPEASTPKGVGLLVPAGSTPIIQKTTRGLLDPMDIIYTHTHTRQTEPRLSHTYDKQMAFTHTHTHTYLTPLLTPTTKHHTHTHTPSNDIHSSTKSLQIKTDRRREAAVLPPPPRASGVWTEEDEKSLFASLCAPPPFPDALIEPKILVSSATRGKETEDEIPTPNSQHTRVQSDARAHTHTHIYRGDTDTTSINAGTSDKKSILINNNLINNNLTCTKPGEVTKIIENKNIDVTQNMNIGVTETTDQKGLNESVCVSDHTHTHTHSTNFSAGGQFIFGQPPQTHAHTNTHTDTKETHTHAEGHTHTPIGKSSLYPSLSIGSTDNNNNNTNKKKRNVNETEIIEENKNIPESKNIIEQKKDALLPTQAKIFIPADINTQTGLRKRIRTGVSTQSLQAHTHTHTHTPIFIPTLI